jgi:hypothetical protein
MPFSHNLKIHAGADLAEGFGWVENNQPVDLTGWHAMAQFRAKADDAEALLTLSTDTGGIVLGANGSIDIKLTRAQTTALTWRSAAWDLSLKDPDGLVHPPLIAGRAEVLPMVTQWP